MRETLFGVVRADRDLMRLAIAMLVVQVVFLAPAALSVAVGGIDGFDGGRLDLRFDRTVPEFFGYAQLLLTVVSLVVAGRRERVRFPLALAAIATMLLIDDALRVHETLGRTIDTMRDGADVGPLRAKDVGDLATWAVLGVLSLALLWWGTRQIAAAELDRAWPWVWVPGLLVAAAVCDVIGASQGIDSLSLADDALEGLALTVAVVLALVRWRRPTSPIADSAATLSTA